MPKYKWENKEEILKAKGKLSKCILGWPGRVLYDLELNPVEISENAVALLLSIEKHPETALGLLPLNLF